MPLHIGGLKSRKSKFWGLESLMSVSIRANFTHLHGKSGGVGGKGGSIEVLILSNQTVEPTPSIPATRAKRWNFYEGPSTRGFKVKRV